MIKNKCHKLSNVSYFEITFNGSSGIEPEGYAGITHLIEHCMCEGIKPYEKKYKNYALTWNAETGKHSMKFYIHGLSKYVNKVKNEYTNAILNYNIPQDIFERERNIVITEYMQNYSDQCSCFISNFNRKHFNSCGPIGYIEDLRNLTYKKFIEYKNKFYSKPSYIGYIHSSKSKDLQLSDLNLNIEFNNIKKYQESVQFGNFDKYPMESYSDFNAQRIILLNNILFNDKELLNNCYAKIFNSCISGGLSSPLYKELREKLQCVYCLGSDCQKISETQLQLFTIVFCDANKVDIVLKKLKETITNIKQFITKKDFKIALNDIKNSIKLTNIVSYNNTNVLSSNYELAYNNFMSNKLTYKGFINFIDTYLKSNITYHIDNEYIKKEDKK